MTNQQQELRSDLLQKHMNKRFHRTRWLIASIALLLVAVGASIWILVNQSTFLAILPVVIFAVLGVLIALLQWLFPFSSTPSTHSPREISLSYRHIVSSPLLTEPRAIQQREQVVKAVYTQLIQSNTTALALTGIGGTGKSTLAALVYRYAEKQRAMRKGPFQSGALWLMVDSTVTFVDLIGNISEALGKPIPKLSDLSPHTQAMTLFNIVNATNKPRLIIFDQFENLLDGGTGHALPDRAGVGEWLDIINGQQCRCRFLLTSRPRPIGTREEPLVYLQEYPVEGLEITEGVALLRNRRVNGTEEELQTAVRRCEGHALSLSLLASLIHDHMLSLTILLENSTLWIEDIARNLLDYLYSKQLNSVQRELLVAFSVYREPVLLEAAEAIITDAPKAQMPDALHVLLVQHLIEPTGKGHYQLHAIIAKYAREHVDENNKSASKQALHKRAAQYYQRQAVVSCLPLDKSGNVSDIHDLVEAIWHYCQAKQRQEAYSLIEQERVFWSLKRWGNNVVLLDICLLLQPQENWSPTPLQAATIHRYTAWAYNAFGKREEARRYNETALQLYTESEDLEGQGNILDALGWSYKTMGQVKQAEEYYKQALAICEKRDDRLAEAHALNGLGQVYEIQGHRKQAQKYYEQALAICKEAKNPQLEGRTLRNLGYIHTDLGDYTKALGYLEQSLVIRKDTGDRRGEGVAYDFLGRAYRERGKHERATQDCRRAIYYFQESLRIYRTIGDRGLEGWALHNLGWTYITLKEYEQAKTFLEQALPIRQEVGDRRGESRTIRDLGELSSIGGHSDQALKYYKQALNISEDISDPYGKGTILQNAALVYIDQAQYDVALSCLLIAKRIFDELQSPYSKETQERIDTLQKKIGKEQFTALLAEIEAKVQQIVEQELLTPKV